MKRPAFQFYPADWRNNANLRRCSWEARGVWIEVMGLLHDSDTYGVLHWPIKEIAQALGAPLKLVKELATKGVMKGCDTGECEPFIYTPRSGRKEGESVLLVPTQTGPVWYSSRMVKDEYVRTIRGESTRFGDSNGDASKHSPKPTFGDGSSTTSSTTSPSLRSGDSAEQVQRTPSRPKSEQVTLRAYLTACKQQNIKPVPDDHYIRQWCVDANITVEMLQVAWVVFREKYTGDEKLKGKRYKDWPGHFANAVKDRWHGLWFIGEDGKPQWTSTGLQRKSVLEAEMKKPEAGNEPS